MIRKTLKIEVVCLFLCFMVMPGTLAFTNEPLVPSPTRSGTILYVGGHGPGNYSTIQDAINASVDGDTIYVYQYSSPYKENIVIEKSISLIGENLNTTIEPQDVNLFSVIIRHDLVSLSNFNFPGILFEYDVKDIYVNNASFVNISNCRLEGADYGMIFNNVSNSIIFHNFFDSFSPMAIFLSKSSNNSIIQNILNIIYRDSGIVITNESSYNIILKNYFWGDSLKYGIIISSSCKSNIITQNNFLCSICSNAKSYWHENYYYNQIIHVFPKIIIPYHLPYPMFNVDWHPARHPYGIPFCWPSQ